MTRPFVSFAEARAINPDKTASIAADRGAWKLTVTRPDGSAVPIEPGSDIEIAGFAGSARVVIALDPKTGQPMYDKFAYEQKPGVVMIAWGLDPADDTLKLAQLVQHRPFAYDPEHPEITDGLDFGHCPMGFSSKAERQLAQRERIEATARREVFEETGATVVRVEIPTPCTFWQDPTVFRNGTDFAFVQVDLGSIGETEKDGTDGEQIKKVEFLPVREVISRIAQGRTSDGAVHHCGITEGPLMVFFARHPELFIKAMQD